MANAQSTVEVLIKAVGFSKVQREANKTSTALKKTESIFKAVSDRALEVKASVESTQKSLPKLSQVQGVLSAKVRNSEQAMRSQIKALRDLQVVVRFNGSLYNKLGAEINRFEAELSKANRTANNAKTANNGLASSLVKIGGAFVTARAAQATLQAGIQRDESERRLRLLTQRFGETAEAQAAAQRAADKFNLSQTEANTQFSRLVARLRPMGMSMKTIETAFAGFNTATILAGATASESAGAFLQLSQALGSGVLRGQELNSILEQAPLIAQAIATEMGTTVGALKKFGEEGKITSEIVIAALGRVEREGAGQLEEALKGPAAAIKDFQNATEDVQVALTQDIIPEMAASFRELATLIESLGPLFRGIGGGLGEGLGNINSLIALVTQPGAVSARKDIERGRVPTNVEGSRELFEPLGGKQFTERLRMQAANAAKITGEEFNKLYVANLQRALQTLDAKNATLPANFENLVFNAPGQFKLNGTQEDGNSKRVDASKELLELNRQLLDSDTQLTELQKINLEFQIEKQQILDRNLLPREEEIALLQAQAGFESDLLGYREDQLRLQQDAADLAERERKKREAEEKRRREADPGFQMQQQLEELLKLENQVAAGATAIGNAFSNSFKAVITGSKSAQEALADMMASVAEHFLDMAAQIIAQQIAMIIYGTIMKALGVGLGGGGEQASNLDSQALFNTDLGLPDIGSLPSDFTFAKGGYVSGPTRALVGEGGEPEYIIPESKMRESMARYSRGARGGSVIPESGAGGTSEDGGGTAVAAPIDVRYTVERINSVDYVTADQFQAGMRQAANQGAKQGEQQTLKRLQMSSGTRKRLGM